MLKNIQMLIQLYNNYLEVYKISNHYHERKLWNKNVTTC
jgi:hypothetical protein